MQSVKLKSIKKIESQGNRYNLEIADNHNYLANNIVVHNCRCHTSKGAMSYRSNKPVISCPHIIKALAPIFDKHPNLRLDGEIYAHKFKDNFNEIISLARKTKPTKEDLKESEAHLEYHVYDCFLGGKEKFSERWAFLQTLSFSGPLKLVDTHCVNNQDELDKLYADWVAEGYEGQMVRFDEPYENKRSKYLLKRKEFQDEEFVITNITEGDGNRSGVAGRCHFLTKEKKEFTANIKGGMKLYKDLLINKMNYIGKEATVKFFNWTPDGLPRFPVVTKLEK